MRIPRGKIVSLIGPNGAGKTSVFNLLTGFYEKDAGTIGFEGAPLEGLKAYDYVKRGIVRDLPERSALQRNERPGQRDGGQSIPYPLLSAGYCVQYPQEAPGGGKRAARRPWSLLEELGLSHLAYERCDALSYGQQRSWRLSEPWPARPSSCCWTSQPRA